MELRVATNAKDQILDITDNIQEVVTKAGSGKGFCNVYVQHTTCSITTADLDPGTDQDMLEFLRRSIPQMNFRHPHDPAHVPDHILSSIIGPSITVPYQNNKLILGNWQRIILVELNGPKERIIEVTVI